MTCQHIVNGWVGPCGRDVVPGSEYCDLHSKDWLDELLEQILPVNIMSISVLNGEVNHVDANARKRREAKAVINAKFEAALGEDEEVDKGYTNYGLTRLFDTKAAERNKARAQARARWYQTNQDQVGGEK